MRLRPYLLKPVRYTGGQETTLEQTEKLRCPSLDPKLRRTGMAVSEYPQEPKGSGSTEQFLYLLEREGEQPVVPEHLLRALKQDPRGPEATYAEGEGEGDTHPTVMGVTDKPSGAPS